MSQSEIIWIRDLIKNYAMMHGLKKSEAIEKLIKKLKKAKGWEIWQHFQRLLWLGPPAWELAH